MSRDVCTSSRLRIPTRVILYALAVALALIWTAKGDTPTTRVVNISDYTVDLHDSEVQAMSAKAEKILVGINKACAELHLKFVGPVVFRPTDAFDNEKMLRGETTSVGEFTGNDRRGISVDSAENKFEFLRSSHKLLRYQNPKIGDQMRGRFFSSWKTWSREQAIKMATPFLKIFTDPLGVKLGDPSAGYDKNVSGGQWCVTWPRVDSQGHPFEADQVAIWLSEGYGPSDVKVELSTPFTEESGKTVSKIDALKVAMSWKGLGGKWHPASSADKLVENKLKGGDLEVVTPQKNADLSLGQEEGASGRLAWVFWFEPIHSDKEKELGWSDSFAIFVDAHTAKIIGSDGYL